MKSGNIKIHTTEEIQTVLLNKPANCYDYIALVIDESLMEGK